MSALKVYIIKNSAGEYCAQSGGKKWSSDIKHARIYTKRSFACSALTYMSKNYLKYKRPYIVEYTAALTNTFNEEERVKKRLRRDARWCENARLVLQILEREENERI